MWKIFLNSYFSTFLIQGSATGTPIFPLKHKIHTQSSHMCLHLNLNVSEIQILHSIHTANNSQVLIHSLGIICQLLHLRSNAKLIAL